MVDYDHFGKCILECLTGTWSGPLIGTAVHIHHLCVVLMQAMSPDGESIVTGAGDETLRFWNVFTKTRSTKVFSSDQFTVFSNLLIYAKTTHGLACLGGSASGASSPSRNSSPRMCSMV